MGIQKVRSMNLSRSLNQAHKAGLTVVRPNFTNMQGNGKLWNWVKSTTKNVGKTLKKAANNPVGKLTVGLYKKYIAPEIKNRILAPVLGSKTDMVENMAKDLVNGKSIKNIVQDTAKDQINEALSPYTSALSGKGMRRLSELMQPPSLGRVQARRINELRPVRRIHPPTNMATQNGSGTQDLISDEV